VFVKERLQEVARGYKFLFMGFNHGGFGVHKKNLMIVPLCD
jgi:hypothetical protein